VAYSLSYQDDSIAAGLRRIAFSQIDAALQDLSDQSLPPADLVLATRKRCKKVRGLIRLGRPAFAAYDDENAALRDIARALGDARDSSAVLGSIDTLCRTFADEIDQESLLPLRERIIAHQCRMTAPSLSNVLSEAQTALTALRQRIADWTLDTDGTDAFEVGLRKTYARAKRLMALAEATRDVEIIHEWRKYAKYHWYHLRLLKRCWPPVMAGYLAVADTLAKALGEHHDLALLKQQAEPLLSRDQPILLKTLNAAATLRQVEIEEHAFRYGRKLFNETPAQAAQRYADWWSFGPATLA